MTADMIGAEPEVLEAEKEIELERKELERVWEEIDGDANERILEKTCKNRTFVFVYRMLN